MMHLSCGDPDLPDAGQGMCCMGSAAMGASKCTCWVPVYDTEQADPCQGPPAVRSKMCGDCAFRDGSPERTGDERYANSEEGDIEDLVASGDPFYCHQGMRRVVRLVHPTGVTVEMMPGSYKPPKHCKADGSPGDICAGWRAAREKFLREMEESNGTATTA